MAHLIPLHRPSGRAVWVNPDHIVTLALTEPRIDEGGAVLKLSNHNAVLGPLYARETPDEILALLGLPGEKPEVAGGFEDVAQWLERR